MRYYQKEADEAIYEELTTKNNDKCLVKMFCGTGKSLLMRICKINEGKNLVVYVFPSLQLIEQFDCDYLLKVISENKKRICSDNDEISTTDIFEIKTFLKSKSKKIVLVTYQSFETLLTALSQCDGLKIDVCHFDEAHHVVGKEKQELIFNNPVNSIKKQIFYTATPKNDNGIVMYDSNNPDTNMCGNLVYDYTYYKGMNEGYLNAFDINVDLYTKNTNKSVYESIARAAINTGNNRVLTFHANVNGNSDTSVKKFVDPDAFEEAYRNVCDKEFHGDDKYHFIHLVAFHSDINIKCKSCKNACKDGTYTVNNEHCCRFNILKLFDATPDNELFIIASCETIGEGIDTKNANMIAFVDPKSSIIAILQNIGRIVRKLYGDVHKRKGTILLPCWINKEKYTEVQYDSEKRDEIIRSDLNHGGDFSVILNVLSALRQEDEELYELCLGYHSNNKILNQDLEDNLRRQNYRLDGPQILENDLELSESMDSDAYYSVSEIFSHLANEYDVNIELHSDTFDTPVEIYGTIDEDFNKETIKILRSYDEETDETRYQSIIHVDGRRRCNDRLVPLEKKERMRMNYHINDIDIQVLWKIDSKFRTDDLSKTIGNCIIDCEVVKYDTMDRAREIVERANTRKNNGGNILPKHIQKKNRTPDEIQEYKDSQKLGYWKRALKGKGKSKCSNEVKEYLDKELPEWNEDLDAKAMENAREIVERANTRKNNGGNILPKHIQKKNRTPDEIQEYKDSQKLGYWKRALKGKGKSKCSNEVKEYLDKELPEWNEDLDAKAMENAREIVERANTRKNNYNKILPRRISKKEVNEYLDKELPKWRHEIDLDDKTMENAREIVERGNTRKNNGGNMLPQQIRKNRRTFDEIQECKDASKLRDWKRALKCSNEVKEYLDKELTKCRDDKYRKKIVKRKIYYSKR